VKYWRTRADTNQAMSRGAQAVLIHFVMADNGPASTPRIRLVSPDELQQERLKADIVKVYLEAFGLAPYYEKDDSAWGFVERLQAHIDRQDYRLLIAESENKMLGFAYGHALARGQWWFDRVTSSLDPILVERWFTGAYSLVELAVLGSCRGRGIGGALHDRILEDLAQRRVVTMAYEVNNPAVDFYKKRDWETLAEGFRFHERDHPRLILGRTVGNLEGGSWAQ
jgi:ribosomal protein S18 acetylase RimI-like enzyme